MRILSKSFTRKHAQEFELRVLETRLPPHVGLRRQERERVVGCHQESVANFGTSYGGVVVCLVLKLPVCFGPDYVAAFAHRGPVFFRPSSRRRCFSSQ